MAEPQYLSQNFSPLQRRLITTALGLTAIAVIGGFTFGILLLLRAFVTFFGGVLWPLAVAGIFALILRPLVVWIHRHLKLDRVKSIALIYSLVLVAAVAVISLVGPMLFEQTLNFIERLPDLLANLRAAVEQRFPEVRAFLVERLGEARVQEYQAALGAQVEKLSGALLPAAQNFMAQLGNLFAVGAGVAIVPVYLFFFLRTERDPTEALREQLSFVKSEWRDDMIFLIHEFAASMEAFFRGQILIGLIMGVLLAAGFTLVGVNFGIGLGLLIGALNIIPYFGTIIGLATVLPIAYLQPGGGLLTAALALLVFILVQMIEGYGLTPKIMGDKTGLHPLVIIIAIFFWGTALSGVLGMILAIPLTAFFVVAWRLLKRKYLEPLSRTNSTAGA